MSRDDHEPETTLDFGPIRYSDEITNVEIDLDVFRETIRRVALRAEEASLRIRLYGEAFLAANGGRSLAEVSGSGDLGRFFGPPIRGTFGGDPGVSVDAMRPDPDRLDEIDEILADTVRMLEQGR